MQAPRPDHSPRPAAFDKARQSTTVQDVSETRAILFYDGDCGLCSRSVRFMLRHDKSRSLYYAPLQGALAAELLDPELRQSLATLVYRNCDGFIRLRSDAVLHALIDTGSGWRYLARPALRLPRNWRDWVYDRIAAVRKRILPKKNCPLLSAEERRRMLP